MSDRAVSPLQALNPLAGRALEQGLSRLLALDPETAAALRPLEGRRIGLALEAPPVALDIRVEDGALRVGPPTVEPDLGIRASLAGDPHLADRRRAGRFDPDWERPFAERLGPVAGPQVARVLREALAAGAGLARGLARDAAEYVTEESRDVVGKDELEAFHADVDALNDRVERLAARVARVTPR